MKRHTIPVIAGMLLSIGVNVHATLPEGCIPANPDDGIYVDYCGAAGDGITDDTMVLNEIYAAAAQWDISDIHYGEGKTYIVRKSYDGRGADNQWWSGALNAVSGLNHLGVNSTLKMMDNASTTYYGGGTYATYQDISIFLVSTYNTEPVHDITFTGINFDLNGQNNPLDSEPHTGRQNFSAFLVTGDDVTVEDISFTKCNFMNSPGKTVLGFGMTNNIGEYISNDITIDQCNFYNNGLDTDDHSTIYGWAENLTVQNSTFNNPTDLSESVNPTCVEVHGAHARIIGNASSGFYTRFAFISTNYINDTTDVIIESNTTQTYRMGYSFFVGNEFFQNLSGVTIRNNIITVTDMEDTVTKYGIQIASAAKGVNGATIENNTIIKEGTRQNFLGISIGNGTEDNPQQDIHIRNNTIINPTVGIYGLTKDASIDVDVDGDGIIDYSTADSRIKDLYIYNNRIIDAVPGPNIDAKGIQVTGKVTNPVESAEIYNNLIFDTRESPLTDRGIRVRNITTPIFYGNFYQGIENKCDDGNIDDSDGCCLLCEGECPSF